MNLFKKNRTIYLTFISLFFWYCGHCAQNIFQTVDMKQIEEQKDRVFTDFVLRSGKVKSLLECASLCAEEKGSQTLTIWPNSSLPSQKCICYAVKSSEFQSYSLATEARCYILEGKPRLECNPAPEVLGTTASSTSVSHVGDVITYMCDMGYKLTGGGDGRRQCGVTAQWKLIGNATDPVCEKIKCGLPPPVTRADAEYASDEFNQTVIYSCNSYSTRTGGSTGLRICSSGGEWIQQKPNPICERQSGGDDK